MTKEVLEMFLSHCMNIWQYSTEKKSSDKVRKFVDNKLTMRHILPSHYTHAVIFTLIELYTKLIDENKKNIHFFQFFLVRLVNEAFRSPFSHYIQEIHSIKLN